MVRWTSLVSPAVMPRYDGDLDYAPGCYNQGERGVPNIIWPAGRGAGVPSSPSEGGSFHLKHSPRANPDLCVLWYKCPNYYFFEEPFRMTLSPELGSLFVLELLFWEHWTVLIYSMQSEMIWTVGKIKQSPHLRLSTTYPCIYINPVHWWVVQLVLLLARVTDRNLIPEECLLREGHTVMCW